ncbi:MAG: type ISP restriction/modification enzyme [Candidatus Bruticola sp.]
MRGNQRTSGDLSRREGGKIFGSGSRTPIAITILVKKPQKAEEKAKIFYHDIGDYLTREDKLKKIKDFGSILNPEMELSSITPSKDHDWINKRSDIFESFIPLNDKQKRNRHTIACFTNSTNGLQSARDIWVYNFSAEYLAANVASAISFFNSQVDKVNNCKESCDIERAIDYDPAKFSWTRSTRRNLLKGEYFDFNHGQIRYALYRPFCKQHVYLSGQLNEYLNQWPDILPAPQSKNFVICVSGIGSKTFSALMANSIPDLHILESATQCFPLYYYELNQAQAGLYESQKDSKYLRREGISDFALKTAQALYGKKISKEDIFYYIYGLLHSPEYRERFKADLTKMLPRIAFVEDAKAFKTIVKIGEKLADLHLNYETAEPYKNVIVTIEQPIYTVEQMRFARIKDEKGKTVDDKRTIFVNRYIKIEEIPLQAYEYVVNGKSPLEWALERYSHTIDKKSGIANDPNAWGNEHNDPQYILNLLLRLITVSVETVKWVAKLPKLDFIKD